MHKAHSLLKHIEDYLLASIFLLMALPLFALIALLIKVTTRGPILIRQQRQGLCGDLFEIYKFNLAPQPSAATAWVKRTNLDELPQLFNVLKGEMSMVGPRPQIPEYNQHCQSVIGDYHQRHQLKPGITGLAQINGLRGPSESEQQLRRRVALERYYQQNSSLGFDLWIILRTVCCSLRHPR